MKVGSLSLFDLKNICIHYKANGSCFDCPLYRLCQKNLKSFIDSWLLFNDVDKRYLVDNSSIILIRDFDCDVRVKNALLRAGFSSFNEVALLSSKELKRIRGFGICSYRYLICLLENLFVDYKINEVKE